MSALIAEHCFVLATAGHVDHGKSSLVKALTGTDPDRLPEEKARGITIDLGFAHMVLAPEPGAETGALAGSYRLGIVDVPGHEDFVKNMVAGVGSIDLALLVVAADDGWMPQTEEHLQILLYLGVKRGVVALTKADLAADEEAVIAAIRERLAGTAFARAPIVATAALTGRGLDELRTALRRVLAETPAPRDFAKPRLPVDRIFTLRGVGTVVTGTLTGGELSRGQAIVVQPAGKSARVRSLHNHSREIERAQPGMRVALNLPDVNTGGPDAPIGRGDVVALPGLGAAGTTVDVVLEKSGREAVGIAGARRPLKDRTRVRVHYGSGNTPATVVLPPGVPALEPGETTLARLRFEDPVYLFAGDRFIIRDWSEQSTLAGGSVLDPDPGERRFVDQIKSGFLQARLAGLDPATLVRSELARQKVVERRGLLIKTRHSTAEIDAAVAQLAGAGSCLERGGRLVDGDWWKALVERAIEIIDDFHRAHPERPGMPLNEWKSALESDPIAAGLASDVLQAVSAKGVAQSGTLVRQATHRLRLPPALQAAGNKIRQTLAAKPLEPPSRKELTPDASAAQALRFLIDSGEAVELSEDIVLIGEAFERCVGLVRAHLGRQREATVSELRQAIGTTRRILVPLLERLDRDGVTTRLGDKRVLKHR